MRPVPRRALHTPLPLLQILMLGGTRFIGVYLARMLVDAGHDVTLLTRGKKPVTFRIPDDTGAAAWEGVQQCAFGGKESGDAQPAWPCCNCAGQLPSLVA